MSSIPLNTRIESAAKAMSITVDQLWILLTELGIEKDAPDAIAVLEAETTCEGDARRIFVDSGTVKIARFKMGWQILKAQYPSATPLGKSSELGQLVEALRSPSQFSDEELLRKYGEQCPDEICIELAKRSKNRAFIIFEDDNKTVNESISLKLLRQARRGETPASYMVNKRIKRLHRVGEFPLSFIEECPIHPNQILIDDYCEECKNTWEGISYEQRQIVRLAVDHRAIDVSTAGKVHELITKINESGIDWLLNIPVVREAYDEATFGYNEDHRLPVLRKKMSAIRLSKADPFYTQG